jgi:PAS domain S-box-containing protein
MKPPDRTGSGAEPIRILYMEDDPGLGRLIQKRLERAGCRVDLAGDGRQGLDMFAAGAYDLVAVDHQMPEADGLDVLRAFAAMPDPPPVVMITGTGSEAVAVEAMKLGAADYVIKDPAGGYLDLVPAIIDRALRKQVLVREKHRAEAALRDSEANFRNVVEQASDGIAILRERKIRYINARGAAMLGDQPKDLVGRLFCDSIHPDDFPALYDWFNRLRAGEAVPPSCEARLRCRDGIDLPVEVTVAATQYNQEPAELVILRDVSLRRRIEEERLKIQRLEAVGQLAAGIAHDFNNMLTGVLGYISLARVSVPPADRADQALAKAEQAVARARETAGRFITFSGGGAPVRRPVRLSDALQEAARAELEHRPIRFVLEISPALSTIPADECQLRQIFMNIIQNAREAAGDDGAVRITADAVEIAPDFALPVAAGAYARVAVADNGPGIPSAHLGRLFDPFFSTKDKNRGLGLSAALNMAKRHGGHIVAGTSPDGGAVVTVYLPLGAGAPDTAGAPATAATSPPVRHPERLDPPAN